MATIFITILGEDWNWVMYVFTRAIGSENAIWYYVAITYFTLIVILGNIILFSLFVAILLENFEGDMSEQIQEHKSHLESIHPDERMSISRKIVSGDCWSEFKKGFIEAFGPRVKKHHSGKVAHDSTIPEPEPKSPVEIDEDEQENSPIGAKYGRNLNPTDSKESYTGANDPELKAGIEKKPEEEGRFLAVKGRQKRARSILMHYDTGQSFAMEIEGKKEVREMTGVSLCCLKSDNCFREFCWKLSTHKWFDHFILALILVSTGTLAIETPMDNPKG